MKIKHWSCEDNRELAEQAKELQKEFGKGLVFVLSDSGTSEAWIADRPVSLSDPIEDTSWAHEVADFEKDVPQLEAEAEARMLLSGFGEWRKMTIRDFFANLICEDESHPVQQ